MKPASITSRNLRRTPTGLVRNIFNNQHKTSKRAGRPKPTYTYEQFENWFLNHNKFQTLYANWVASNYDRQLSPSADRLDNKLGYSLSNIQLVTAHENLMNQKKQHRTEEHLHTKSRSICQLNEKGEVIAVFGSIRNALRSVKAVGGSPSNIAQVANGVWKTAYNHRWAWV